MRNNKKYDLQKYDDKKSYYFMEILETCDYFNIGAATLRSANEKGQKENIIFLGASRLTECQVREKTKLSK